MLLRGTGRCLAFPDEVNGRIGAFLPFAVACKERLLRGHEGQFPPSHRPAAGASRASMKGPGVEMRDYEGEVRFDESKATGSSAVGQTNSRFWPRGAVYL